MKKLLALSILIGIVTGIRADEYPPRSVPVYDVSTVVMPAMKPDAIQPYVTDATYTQGVYVVASSNDSGATYWMVSPTSGISAGVLWTNESLNLDIIDGVVHWRSIPKTRNWFRISNISTIEMFYSEGQGSVNAAVMDKGIFVATNDYIESRRGTDWGAKCYQGQVNMISVSTNNPLAVFED